MKLSANSVLIYLAQRQEAKDLLPFFPHVFREGEDIPAGLRGMSTVVRIGTSQSRELVIEYRTSDKSELRRLTLGFGDRGVWIKDDVPLSLPIQGEGEQSVSA